MASAVEKLASNVGSPSILIPQSRDEQSLRAQLRAQGVVLVGGLAAREGAVSMLSPITLYVHYEPRQPREIKSGLHLKPSPDEAISARAGEILHNNPCISPALALLDKVLKKEEEDNEERINFRIPEEHIVRMFGDKKYFFPQDDYFSPTAALARAIKILDRKGKIRGEDKSRLHLEMAFSMVRWVGLEAIDSYIQETAGISLGELYEATNTDDMELLSHPALAHARRQLTEGRVNAVELDSLLPIPIEREDAKLSKETLIAFTKGVHHVVTTLTHLRQRQTHKLQLVNKLSGIPFDPRQIIRMADEQGLDLADLATIDYSMKHLTLRKSDPIYDLLEALRRGTSDVIGKTTTQALEEEGINQPPAQSDERRRENWALRAGLALLLIATITALAGTSSSARGAGEEAPVSHVEASYQKSNSLISPCLPPDTLAANEGLSLNEGSIVGMIEAGIRRKAITHPFPPSEVGNFYQRVSVDENGEFVVKGENPPTSSIREPVGSQMIESGSFPTSLTEGVVTANLPGVGGVIVRVNGGISVITPEGVEIASWHDRNSPNLRIINMPTTFLTEDGRLLIGFSGHTLSPPEIGVYLLELTEKGLALKGSGYPFSVNALGTPILYQEVNAGVEGVRIVYPEGYLGLPGDKYVRLLNSAGEEVVPPQVFPGIRSISLASEGDIDPGLLDRAGLAFLDSTGILWTLDSNLNPTGSFNRRPTTEGPYKPMLVMVRLPDKSRNTIVLSEGNRVTAFDYRSTGGLSERWSSQLPMGEGGQVWVTSVVPLDSEILVTGATDFFEDTVFVVLDSDGNPRLRLISSETPETRFGSYPVVIQRADGTFAIYSSGFTDDQSGNQRAVFGHLYVPNPGGQPIVTTLPGFPKLFGTWGEGVVSVAPLAAIPWKDKWQLVAQVSHTNMNDTLHIINTDDFLSEATVSWGGIRGNSGNSGAPPLPRYQGLIWPAFKNYRPDPASGQQSVSEEPILPYPPPNH